MTRRDKVLAALTDLTRERGKTSENPAEIGFTTEELAQHTGILRNNCSAALNELVREGLVEKTSGRPTLYQLTASSAWMSAVNKKSFSPASEHVGVSFFSAQNSLTNGLGSSGTENVDALSGRVGSSGVHESGIGSVHGVRTPPMDTVSGSDFDWGVATDRSLHDAVQQAKMALTYPPYGMHVLLLGETGVGKSTFSRRMHEYALQYGVLQEDAPFVTFNCSEYANNPEILLDQLFGHVRGAYTGAHGDKPGLVDQANDGMLFLDEVHRLPPQGQEMLFHLLDYGTFRRLGETQLERRSRVLLVAATTESPESALLSTFRRRIPVVIRLPALRDWALYDRYELVYSLCRDEAKTLGMPIRVSAAALDTLLFSRFSANIGDLKNTVKLACARAYNSKTSTVINVLPEHVVVNSAEGPHERLLRSLSQSSEIMVSPDGQGPPPLPALEEGSRHAKLDRLSQTLYDLGFGTEEILESLERELKKQDQSGDSGPASIEDLRQFVGEPFFNSILRAWRDIEPGLAEKDRETALLRVAMHLYGVVRSGRQYAETSEGGLLEITERVKTDSPEAFRFAGRLLARFSAIVGGPLPEYETAIVAMLLRPQEANKSTEAGLVVALFGDSIARHMVETAARLTNGYRAIAVDIPFQTPREVMDNRLTEAVNRADTGNGVLLLTDVPRFANGGGWDEPDGMQIERVLRPDLRTIVSALHGIQTGKLSLSDLAAWLRTRNQGVEMMAPARKRVVWGCCLTGKGTARAVERLIRDALPPDLYDRVEVIPKELGHSDVPHVPDEGLVAAVGSVDPGIFGVPFFSVEALLSREGIEQLLNVLYMGDTVSTNGDCPPGALGGLVSVDIDANVDATRDANADAATNADATIDATIDATESRWNASGKARLDVDQNGADMSSSAVITSSSLLSSPPHGSREEALQGVHEPKEVPGAASKGAGDITHSSMERYIENLLQRDLVFVNPDLALRVSRQVWDKMVSEFVSGGLKSSFKRETYIRFCLHMAYVIERLIKQDEMFHPYASRIASRYRAEWSVMQKAWQPVTDVFRIAVSEHELAYLFELVFAERELEVFDG